jgi:hypothetical protein
MGASRREGMACKSRSRQLNAAAGPKRRLTTGDQDGFEASAPRVRFVERRIAGATQRVVGALGTLVTVIVIILFGKPSDGGSNGVPYLPEFWSAIGPYLPPRNGFILLRNSVYFDGNGITQALVVLLVYLVVLAVLIGILDWYRRPPLELPAVSHETEASAAAASTPAGVAT